MFLFCFALSPTSHFRYPLYNIGLGNQSKLPPPPPPPTGPFIISLSHFVSVPKVFVSSPNDYDITDHFSLSLSFPPLLYSLFPFPIVAPVVSQFLPFFPAHSPPENTTWKKLLETNLSMVAVTPNFMSILSVMFPNSAIVMPRPPLAGH